MQSGAALRVLDATGAGKITHIVYIVQENRSFNDLFNGYPGAHTVTSGKISTGETVKLQPVPLSDQYMIDHSLGAFIAACDGTGSLPGTDCRNDGFNNEETYGGPSGVKYPEYVYVPHCRLKAILRHGARRRACRPYVPIATRRELRRASVHHRRAGKLERRPSLRILGLRRKGSSEVAWITDGAHDRRISVGMLRLPDLGRRTRQGETLVAFLRQQVWRGQRRRSGVVELSGG